MDDVQDVFFRQRLKVQPIGGIVIRAHGFRIAIHHDGLNAFVPQRHGCVHTAIVELDALSNSVGTSAQDDYLLPTGRARLAFSSISGIQIGSVRFEFRGAGIHAVIRD